MSSQHREHGDTRRSKRVVFVAISQYRYYFTMELAREPNVVAEEEPNAATDAGGSADHLQANDDSVIDSLRYCKVGAFEHSQDKN
jgi:hypothetical protein